MAFETSLTIYQGSRLYKVPWLILDRDVSGYEHRMQVRTGPADVPGTLVKEFLTGVVVGAGVDGDRVNLLIGASDLSPGEFDVPLGAKLFFELDIWPAGQPEQSETLVSGPVVFKREFSRAT